MFQAIKGLYASWAARVINRQLGDRLIRQNASKGVAGSNRIKIANNHPDSEPFVIAVGKLIQNMGMIENQTYEWIAALQNDSIVVEIARRSKLQDRIEIINKLIQRSTVLSQKQKKSFREIWASVLPHSQVRNIVAHSCVMMGFPNDDPTQPALVKGVINYKPRDKTRMAELVSVQEINGSVNATFRIASSLLESLKDLAAPLSDSSSASVVSL